MLSFANSLSFKNMMVSNFHDLGRKLRSEIYFQHKITAPAIKLSILCTLYKMAQVVASKMILSALYQLYMTGGCQFNDSEQ